MVKVKTKDGIVGFVDYESWANPRTQLMDIVASETITGIISEGDTKPVYKDDLEYLGVE